MKKIYSIILLISMLLVFAVFSCKLSSGGNNGNNGNNGNKKNFSIGIQEKSGGSFKHSVDSYSDTKLADTTSTSSLKKWDYNLIVTKSSDKSKTEKITLRIHDGGGFEQAEFPYKGLLMEIAEGEVENFKKLIKGETVKDNKFKAKYTNSKAKKKTGKDVNDQYEYDITGLTENEIEVKKGTADNYGSEDYVFFDTKIFEIKEWGKGSGTSPMPTYGPKKIDDKDYGANPAATDASSGKDVSFAIKISEFKSRLQEAEKVSLESVEEVNGDS